MLVRWDWGGRCIVDFHLFFIMGLSVHKLDDVAPMVADQSDANSTIDTDTHPVNIIIVVMWTNLH